LAHKTREGYREVGLTAIILKLLQALGDNGEDLLHVALTKSGEAREDIRNAGMAETTITNRLLPVFTLFECRPVILQRQEKSLSSNDCFGESKTKTTFVP
jgi:hypothetical protein